MPSQAQAPTSQHMSRYHNEVVKIDTTASPNDVTAKLLTSLLNTHYKIMNLHSKDIQVASFQWQPLGRGFMSNVQLLTVCYETDYLHSTATGGVTRPDMPPNNMQPQFLAKFRKEEIPLEDLFSVEGQFYQLARELFASDSKVSCESANKFPFRLVDAIATGPSWLLLEYIPPENMIIIDVHEGCPPDRFDDLLVRLARMHATCWVSNTTSESSKESTSISSILKKHALKLSPTPGAGHSLPPSIRQEQFQASWPAVRERLIPYFQSDEGVKSLGRMDQTVSWTAQSPRIEEIAQSVAERKYTVVHGDFHIGNMLLQKTQTNNDEEMKHPMPWLVDWSMAGIGNPCVDLVFFLVVGADAIPIHEISSSTDVASSQSTNATATEHVRLILEQYYQALTSETQVEDATNEPSNAPSQSSQHPLLPWETFLTMFSQCLLNQFIILACYDSLCRSMADASPISQLYHDHFDRVNTRCVRMLLSEYGMTRFFNIKNGSEDNPCHIQA